MNLSILLSLLVCLLGLVVYLITAHPKASEVGKISFAMGLLAFLLTVGHATLRIGVG